MNSVRLVHEESGTRVRWTATLRGSSVTIEQGGDERRRTRRTDHGSRTAARSAFEAAVERQRATGYLDLDPRPGEKAFLVEGHEGHGPAVAFIAKHGAVECNLCEDEVATVRVGEAPEAPIARGASKKKLPEPRVDEVAFQHEFVWPLVMKRREGTILRAAAFVDAVAQSVARCEDGRAIVAELEATRRAAKLVSVGRAQKVDSAVDRIGGMPSWIGPAQWPTCRRCKRPMMFLMQFDTGAGAAIGSAREGRLFVFQCQNEPGMCDDWDANAGGSAVIWQPGGDAQAPVDMSTMRDLRTYGRAKSGTLWCGRLPSSWALSYRDVEEVDEPSSDRYTDDRSLTIASLLYQRHLTRDRVRDELASKVGGHVRWLQGEEVPSCTACRKPMRFVAQVSAVNDVDSLDNLINFGDVGVSYLFVCDADGAAKWLWQCG